MNRRHLLSLGSLAAGLCLAGSLFAAPAKLYDHSIMKKVELNGLRVWLGQPVEVTSQIGWGMDWVHPGWQPAWSFIHLTPFMARFPGGNLIATYTMDPDTQENPFFLSAFQISRDGGAHWDRRYTVLMQHIPMLFIPQEHDSLLGIPSELMYRGDGDWHNFVGPAYLFEHGGAKMVLIPDGVQLLDWPWPTRLDPSMIGKGKSHVGENNLSGGPQPRANWHVGLSITGTALKMGDQWIATVYGRKGDVPARSSMLIASKDNGKTWRYYSTIAEGDPASANAERYEGPDETSLVQLGNGDIMAVFRVGSGTHWHVHRSYSHDQGRTWTPPDALPAWSVEPQVIRASNGTIALATGRPGVYLWLAGDPAAKSWQSIDIVAHHNSVIGDPTAEIRSFKRPAQPERSRPEYDAWQTTAYTALVETSPNHLLLIYDRDAERKPVDEKDISRVYVLPIEVERK